MLSHDELHDLQSRCIEQIIIEFIPRGLYESKDVSHSIMMQEARKHRVLVKLLRGTLLSREFQLLSPDVAQEIIWPHLLIVALATISFSYSGLSRAAVGDRRFAKMRLTS